MIRFRLRMDRGARGLRVAVAWLLAGVLCTWGSVPAVAGTERYEYDPLGRLVRMIDGQGRVAEYDYDAVGNLLEVRSGGIASAPSITDISPAALRRGSSAAVVVNGANLTNVTVSTADPGLQVSGVVASATRVSFTLAASVSATLGAAPIVFRNVAGEATRSIAVQPLLPVLAVVPTPLAIPPDNLPHSFIVSLDHADTIDHTVAVSADQPTIASVGPASAVIAAGQTQAIFQVTGRLGGQTIIRLASPTLAAAAVPVFVTAEFRGINTAYAPLVGVDLAAGTALPSAPVGLHSRLVGVGVGPVWVDTAPRGLLAGTSGTLSIRGSALSLGLSVTVEPGGGVVLGAPALNSTGTELTLPISMAADAVLGARRVLLQAGGVGLAVATPGADRIDVLRPAPEIFSISPVFGAPGATINPFVVRGRNLSDAQGLSVSGAGVLGGAQPTVSSDGAVLTGSLAVSSDAVPGARTVSVLTPSGDSGNVASSANTFTVAASVGDTYASLASPHVGVNLADGTAAPATGASLYAAPVGVSLGGVVNSLTPATAATGQSLTVVIGGRELAGVSSVTITPSTGLVLGTPAIAPDGSNVQLPLTVAADAPLGLRRLQVYAGAAALPFAAPGGDRFDITPPVPVLASVDPIVAQVGSTVGFVLRGVNLQGAVQVRVTPPAGATVGMPGVNAAGDVASVLIAFDANAAPGQRVVSVVTPAGESGVVLGPNNTITLSATPGTTYANVAAPLVGIELAGSAVAPSAPQSLYARSVGVDLASGGSAPTAQAMLVSSEVGAAVGAVATGVEPGGFAAGGSGNVIVRGVGFAANTTITFTGPPGIGLNGAPSVATDGSSLTQAVAIAADAVPAIRGVQLSAGGSAVVFAPGVPQIISIGSAAVPNVASLTPILARQGETVALTIRGSNFDNVVEVLVEPAAGIVFDNQRNVAPDGSQIDVRLFIPADAALGGRVIRVRTLGGLSSGVAAPANTFTVYPP